MADYNFLLISTVYYVHWSAAVVCDVLDLLQLNCAVYVCKCLLRLSSGTYVGAPSHRLQLVSHTFLLTSFLVNQRADFRARQLANHVIQLDLHRSLIPLCRNKKGSVYRVDINVCGCICVPCPVNTCMLILMR